MLNRLLMLDEELEQISMTNQPIAQFAAIVNGKALQADILEITSGDNINIKFSDGYQNQFIFLGEDGDEIIGLHFEKSSPYAVIQVCTGSR